MAAVLSAAVWVVALPVLVNVWSKQSVEVWMVCLVCEQGGSRCDACFVTCDCMSGPNGQVCCLTCVQSGHSQACLVTVRARPSDVTWWICACILVAIICARMLALALSVTVKSHFAELSLDPFMQPATCPPVSSTCCQK
jgi:hypothetical protein